MYPYLHNLQTAKYITSGPLTGMFVNLDGMHIQGSAGCDCSLSYFLLNRSMILPNPTTMYGDYWISKKGLFNAVVIRNARPSKDKMMIAMLDVACFNFLC